ncbi:hypothetical protein HH213_23375 [Duganella dendranthematis]|uniref:Uncharacterized protein n=1 Tax=Duganella dendranthematis TaxID=2728021 RepID=A0ABX6MEK7_9BURK|nr:hypothetical protein [Duganella dendranthematis]QJD92769.1 hypothetical protein HH213_23375 [Duganella dendranthematis]
MNQIVPPASFQNVLVSVKPREGKPGKYDVSTVPAVPVITQQDTIINYQIVDTDGQSIVFSGMSVKPKDNNQLSEETLSLDKKMLAFFDANTEKMTLNITLHFQDGEGIEFSHDPQVDNDPEA